MTENQNQVQEVKGGQVVEITNGRSLMRMVIEGRRQQFLQVNEGLDLDFVHMHKWLTKDALGQVIDKNNPDKSYGMSIDVLIGSGERRYVLWGKENTAESGELIVAEREREDAERKFLEWLQSTEYTDEYTIDDVKLNYLALMVMVKDLEDLNGKFPPVYIMSLPTSDSLTYGNYAINIFNGEYEALGIPTGTAVPDVVTRITSYSRNKGKTQWIARKFEPVGIFNPSDYGIK